jgi:hypothetical protein
MLMLLKKTVGVCSDTHMHWKCTGSGTYRFIFKRSDLCKVTEDWPMSISYYQTSFRKLTYDAGSGEWKFCMVHAMLWGRA